jgi:hypothetical protein
MKCEMKNRIDKKFIIELLDRRFSHRDFSILNRKWKLFHIEQVASEIMQIINLEIERNKKNET